MVVLYFSMNKVPILQIIMCDTEGDEEIREINAFFMKVSFALFDITLI